MDWIIDVNARLKRKNEVLFRQDSPVLAELAGMVENESRRALVLWAFSLAEETVALLEARYPDETRPRAALEQCRAWAAGDIKMPVAKRAILNAHAAAKTLPAADAARCHAVAQACSVVHTPGHALGYPIYELTAIVREAPQGDWQAPVENRAAQYTRQLTHWHDHLNDEPRRWAAFLADA